MSLVLNLQRPALESLVSGKDERELLSVSLRDTKFFLGETPVYLCGISNGVGSCAEMHGVNIAVFSFVPPTEPCEAEVKSCVYAALVRNLTEEEVRQRPYSCVSYKVVEGLRVEKAEWDYVVFELDGTKATYTNTI